MGQTQKIYSSEKGRETEREGGVYIYDSASLTHRATGHYFLFRCFVGRAGLGYWLTVAFSHFLFPKQQVTFSPLPKIHVRVSLARHVAINVPSWAMCVDAESSQSRLRQ
jgi:hypothetical protein